MKLILYVFEVIVDYYCISLLCPEFDITIPVNVTNIIVVCFWLDGLFQLLMEISSVGKAGTEMVLPSLACSSLISLIIALGDTGKLLTAITAMVMSPGPLAVQDLNVTAFYCALIKCFI